MNTNSSAVIRFANRFPLAPPLAAAALLLLFAVACFAQGGAVRANGDTPAALPHVAKATQIAGNDLAKPLFLCRPNGGNVVATAQREGSSQWLEPAKALVRRSGESSTTRNFLMFALRRFLWIPGSNINGSMTASPWQTVNLKHECLSTRSNQRP